MINHSIRSLSKNKRKERRKEYVRADHQPRGMNRQGQRPTQQRRNNRREERGKKRSEKKKQGNRRVRHKAIDETLT
jgi:hypothetical protein